MTSATSDEVKVGSTRRRMGRLTAYWLALPGGLWLAIFFVIPMIYLLSLSLMTGNFIDGFTQTFHVSTYWHTISLYHDQFIRSIIYALIVTALTITLAYPMAYWIAMRGGKHKSTYLLIILLPFFVSFVIRTLQWQFILADNGFVLGTLKDLHLVGSDFHLLATPVAVICGLTYNYLPFMVLPLYVSIERLDPRLMEAANDLYASKLQALLRIVFPLTIPGIFAGVIMTFVPVASDFVNAQLLGGAKTTMIGNVIYTLYLTNNDYAAASALSFTLMGALLIGIFIYARALGTKDVMEAAAL
ncbi:ABC transporter permease [Flexivirga endophytica]|uniref:ABC transporter permease n=1 Tax=Flexivirga endophytica TaxID=1849103 RepID=A0A916SYL6_9MICO|nr:ABC transporter permease [Flexivirga endophytica]GGB23674.1 ABC transporter permease [Flexivirga endophytica]GHB57602.1 ABC transporter permease [Flexivirga endophytica]